MRKEIIAAVVAALLPTIAMAQAPARSAPIMPTPKVGDPGPDGARIDKDGVFANFFPSKTTGRGRHPGILLLGGSEGGLGAGGGGFIKALTSQGYDVLYLCYFGCPGTPPQLVAVPLETFDRGLAFLRAQAGVDPKRVAVVGGSKGGEAALLVATRDRKLKAVVAGMPSSVAWPGVSTTAATQPSWTVGAAPVPFLPYSFASFAKGGVFGLYNGALPNVAQHPDAVIPVERVAGRILLVCGEADSLWPSCPMADQVAERLKSEHRPAATVLRYKDAGHQVFGTPVELPAAATTSNASLASLGGTSEGNMAARADGWPKVEAFLKAALKP